MASEFHTNFKPYVPKKGEQYMSPKQLEHFRKILNQLKVELSQDIDRTVHTMQDEATIFADPNDRASQESDMSLELRNRDRERKLIKKIEETIGRIDSGEYGYCDSCGVEIGLKRLEARPTATLCIEVPSSQWAMSGHERTTRSHVSSCANDRAAVSRALVMTPIPHVPLSAGSVSVENDS